MFHEMQAIFSFTSKHTDFRTSFGEDANTSAASLLTRDCLVFVRWPCNVLCFIMHNVYNNNNNNNKQMNFVLTLLFAINRIN